MIEVSSGFVIILSGGSVPVGGHIVEGLLLRLERHSLIKSLRLLHLSGKQLVVVLLSHLLLLVRHISVMLDLSVDFFKLPQSLVNRRIKLHRILGCVPQSLLEIGNLSGQLSLGGFIIINLSLKFKNDYNYLHLS